ncbi:MAG: chloride channel protein [Cytophagaceae bacterium]
MRVQLVRFLPFLAASFIVGLVAFIYSRVFTYSEKLSHYIFEQNHLFIFISTPVSFLLSWWIVNRFAPFSRGSGIPQVMAALELTNNQEKKGFIDQFLNLKVIAVKFISSCVKVIGGGILGREGPTIQIASSIFNKIQNWIPPQWQQTTQNNVLVAGAASGLAAAFNTPLGGIIFAIEELSKYHINQYKSTLFIAVIIAGLTAQGFGGSYLYLGSPNTSLNSYYVLLAIPLVGLITGIAGSKMCTILLHFMRFVKSLSGNFKQVSFIILSGLIVAGFIYFVGIDAMGSGKELMERLLHSDNKTVEWYVPFVRLNGLILSFGIGGAGGIFAPALSSGAGFGALVAQLMHIEGSDANLLILVGMAGFLTAVTRAPFTSAIIIFEMTDRHSIIFFLLIGALVANVVAAYIDKRPFYNVLKEGYLNEINQKKDH